MNTSSQKNTPEEQVNLIAVEVAAKELLALKHYKGKNTQKCFTNTSAGHKQLINWATDKEQIKARVILEATGSYSLGLCLALDASSSSTPMLLNPSQSKAFAGVLNKRAKTDRVDLQTLLVYLQRMDFVPWIAPEKSRQELQQLNHRRHQLVQQHNREKNHLHAAQCQGSKKVINDIEKSLTEVEKHLGRIEMDIEELIREDEQLSRAQQNLCSIKGVAKVTSAAILAEVASLPGDMKAHQWVAYAGLDPRAVESGSSVCKVRRISKRGNVHLRRALYMSAWIARRYEPAVKAYYEHLICKGKKPMQAIVAVMRKLLRSICAMLKNNTVFEPQAFYQVKT